jgi:electron transport complex protein RnfA
MFGKLFVLAISAILVENFVLVKFLGICPFLGVSNKKSSAIGMSGAVIFVMALSSPLTWVLYNLVLVPLKLEYLRIIVFILIIASLVQLIQMFLRKRMPALFNALGIYLPLITTNCAILAVPILNVDRSYSFIFSLAFGIFAGLGFALALILFSSIRDRLEFCDVPKPFKGLPITLIAAGLLSLAFMGFQGLKLPF